MHAPLFTWFLKTLVSSPLWSPLSGDSNLTSHTCRLSFPIYLWFHTMEHLGPFFTQNLSLLFIFFFLDRCSYSSNLNEPILPKVFMVLHGLPMWLHRVVPYPLQPPGTRLAVRKELSQTDMLMLSYLKVGPGNINYPVSKHCPASSPLGAPHQPQVGLLEQLQISLQYKGEFCSWSWPIMANIF